jgi:hypothetical protein
MARRETGKKRSIHVVCEHFEPFCNAARGVYIYFEIGSTQCLTKSATVPNESAADQGCKITDMHTKGNLALRQ